MPICSAPSNSFGARGKISRQKVPTDVGRRSDVTAAGHMDGFVGLFKRIAVETGVPEDYVKTGKIKMPEYLTSKNRF